MCVKHVSSHIDDVRTTNNKDQTEGLVPPRSIGSSHSFLAFPTDCLILQGICLCAIGDAVKGPKTPSPDGKLATHVLRPKRNATTASRRALAVRNAAFLAST